MPRKFFSAQSLHADGSLVEGWTSTKTPHTVRGLELEKEYTLTEKRAPDGYAEAESIVFKLVQEGTEQVNEVYTKLYKLMSTNPSERKE